MKVKLLFFLSFVLSSQLVQHCPESTSINRRFQGSVSSCTTSFVEHRFLLATFCHHKYFKRRIVYSCVHPGTFNPVIITKKKPIVYRYLGRMESSVEDDYWPLEVANTVPFDKLKFLKIFIETFGPMDYA